jgi:hypothetical protein
MGVFFQHYKQLPDQENTIAFEPGEPTETEDSLKIE